jgi:hypothetical protein
MANTFNHNDKVVITDGGSVGIGTTSPGARLEVKGNGTGKILIGDIGGYANYAGISLNGSAAAGYYNILSRASDGTLLLNRPFGDIAFWENNATLHMIIKGTSGNVGIGTTSPSEHLSIEGTGDQALSIYSSTTGVQSTARTFIKLFGQNTASTKHEQVRIASAPGATASTAGQLIISTNNTSGDLTERLRIDEIGNVGIGTTSPSSPFTVATDVRADSLTATDLRPQSQINLLGGGGDSLFIGQLTNSTVYMQSSYFNATLAKYPISINPLGGNVGIGTTSPGSTLSVNGTNSGSVPLLDLTASGTGAFQRGVRMLNTGMSAGDSIMMCVGNRDNSKNMGQFYFYYAGNASNSNRISMGLHSVDDVFNILGTGNVGIGTTTPGAKLTIGTQSSGQNGTGNSSDNSIIARIGASQAAGRVYALTLANTAAAAVGNDASLSFVTAENWSATGVISVIAKNASAAYSDMAFSVYNNGNVERMRIVGETGNVGIGTTSPAYKLEVSGGAISIKGNAAGNSLRFDDSGGTSRNAMYLDTSNYLNVGNSNYAGIKLYHTATAPQANGLEGNQIAEGYGITENGKVLAEPDAWLAVRIGTTDYAIPMYTTG